MLATTCKPVFNVQHLPICLRSRPGIPALFWNLMILSKTDSRFAMFQTSLRAQEIINYLHFKVFLCIQLNLEKKGRVYNFAIIKGDAVNSSCLK